MIYSLGGDQAKRVPRKIVTMVTIVNYNESAVDLSVKLLPPCLILLLSDYFRFTLPLHKVLPIHSPLGPAKVPSIFMKITNSVHDLFNQL